MKRICLLILVLVWAWSLFGNTPSLPGDSVGVKQDGTNSFIIYKVSAGETVFSVCRKYGIPYQSVVNANPGIDMNSVKAGQQILVPARYEINSAEQTNNFSYVSVLNEYHRVEQGETFYGISKKYNADFAELTKLNPQIKNFIVKPGDMIKLPATENVKKEEKQLIAATNEINPANKGVEGINVKNTPLLSNEKTVPKQIKTETIVTAGNATVDNSSAPAFDKNKGFDQLYAEYASMNLTPVSEKGVATWIDGSNDFKINNNRFYALNNQAPVGSVIRIRNLMNNRIIYAKVIGTLSESEVSENVLVKLSAGAAEKLNVLDNRFVAEATYYTVIENIKK